ncbi:MAG: DUF4340 domain-containing protein [Pirellulales bacterium]|nr:DUF4340 domain-containing protein [Pirellulales bacterium]
MSENVKTVTFVVAALVVGLVAWSSLPAAPQQDSDTLVGQFLSPDFTDPLAGASLEIIDFDEEKAEPSIFKVEQVNGRWALPSHSNYPADADKQMAHAAASLIDLEILRVDPVTQSDFELYGVVDPTSASIGAGGIGKKITLKDKAGKTLTELIVGKEVEGQPGIRYVRVPNRDVLFQVKFDPSKLTTRFAEWIEDDLLKLNPWDVEDVVIDNYSIDEAQGRRIQGDVVKLTYNDKEAQWKLDGLTEAEELDATKLNDMKTALDELRIVDVRRKPAGLSSMLKSEGEGRIDQQALLSLMSKGFYVTQDGSLLSNEGEIVTTLKDGVEYVLRFGEIATGTESDEAKPAEGEEPLATVHETGPNRYLMLTVGFNPNKIPPPQLEEVPPAPGAAAPEGEQPAEGETPPAAEETPEQKAARETIERENKRKQDEYETKIKDAQKKVKELNDRFADWYYVIPNDVYRKIRLSRDQVVKKPEPDEIKSDADELKKLKEAGLEASGAEEATPEEETRPAEPAEPAPVEEATPAAEAPAAEATEAPQPQ